MPRKKQTASPLPAGLSKSEEEGTNTSSLEDVKEPATTKKKPGPAKKKPAAPVKKTPVKKTPVAELQEIEVETPEELSPWEKVDSLSDDKLLVEAVNIAPFGKKCVMLRFLVDGKLHGNVITIHDIQFRVGSGKFT